MEPHWNESKITQVIGRAIRYKSHEKLPINERNVDIYRWASVFPEPYRNQSADEYLIDLSVKKQICGINIMKLLLDHRLRIILGDFNIDAKITNNKFFLN
nr:ATP dependent helicase [Mimivirus sp.]